MLVERITNSTILGFDGDNNPDNMDAYQLVGQIKYADDVAIVEAVLGNLPIEHMRELVAICLRRKCRFIISKRSENSCLPVGHVVESGPFAGWWYIVLDELIGTRFRSVHHPAPG
jgi:hypothetical protein